MSNSWDRSYNQASGQVHATEGRIEDRARRVEGTVKSEYRGAKQDAQRQWDNTQRQVRGQGKSFGQSVKEFLFSGGDISAAAELERAKQNSSAYVQSGLSKMEAPTQTERISYQAQRDNADAVSRAQHQAEVVVRPNKENADAVARAQQSANEAVEAGKRLGREGKIAAKEGFHAAFTPTAEVRTTAPSR